MINPNPILPKYPTLFHCLALMEEHLELCLMPDIDDYQSWYTNLRTKTEKEMAKLTALEVKEKWYKWKADQIDCCAAA